jgi:hypothetical protein
MALYETDHEPVPIGIRTVRIDFGVEMLQPAASACYFDNLILTLNLRR